MGERIEFADGQGGLIDPEQIADERLAAIFQLFNDMQCGIVLLDAQGAIFASNERVRTWLGYPGEGDLALRGRMVRDIIAPEMQQRFDENHKRVMEGDLRASVTILRRVDGTTFPVLSIPHRFVREGWENVATFGVLVDLATIQTAETGETGASGDVCSTLDRVAVELRAISLAISASSRVTVPVGHPALEELTDREMEVVVQLVSGQRVPAIAKALYISPNTVRNHLKAVYRKLDVHSQSALLEKVASLSGAAD